MNAAVRYTVPSDYRSLWLKLDQRLVQLKQEDALSLAAATKATEPELRRLQGRCEAYDLVRAEMQILLDQERSDKRP